MAKVSNAVEKLPKIWTAWVGRTNVTDDRQTTDGRAIAYSERELQFTFAKKVTLFLQHIAICQQVFKVIWQKGHTAAAHGRFSGICQVAPVCTPTNTCFLAHPSPQRKTASWSVQPVLHSSRQSIPILYNGLPLSPLKVPLPIARSGLHLTCDSVGLPQSTTQTVSQPVQPSLQGSRLRQTDQTERPTDRQTMLLSL